MVGGKRGDVGHVLTQLSQFQQEASTRFDSSEDREQLPEEEEKGSADAKNEKELTPEVQPVLEVAEVGKETTGKRI